MLRRWTRISGVGDAVEGAGLSSSEREGVFPFCGEHFAPLCGTGGFLLFDNLCGAGLKAPEEREKLGRSAGQAVLHVSQGALAPELNTLDSDGAVGAGLTGRGAGREQREAAQRWLTADECELSGDAPSGRKLVTTM